MYRSTRGDGSAKSFSQAVLEGLAEDGGLLVPDEIPNLKARYREWIGLDYAQLAVEVLSSLVDDIPTSELSECCQKAYGPRYGGPVAPLVGWGDRYVLELFHGPTLAFKDVALQLLGQLFEHVLEREDRHLNIVAATSGDTGSAAIHGVLGCPRVKIFVTHPKGRIAELQRLQMSTVMEENVFNLPVDGTFDDCQALVKELSSDLGFKRRYSIGAVNSINWARIAAQIVYYFAAYLQTPGASRGVPAVFAVPTGNFGNILAAEYARRMGLPIAELILASNENDILPQAFRTGLYRRGEARHTYSPAMDIQVSSNFERYLYLLADGNTDQVRQQMQTFATEGEVQLSSHEFPGWFAASCSDQNTLETVSEVHQKLARTVDPHTATAWWALNQRWADLDPEYPKIVVSTAHPAKFPEVLAERLPSETQDLKHPALEALRGLPERLFEVPADISTLKEFVATHAAASQGGVFSKPEEKAR